MSADNGVYILVTKDFQQHVGHIVQSVPNGILAYRVAYAQGIDNLEWYEKQQPYNVGYFLHKVWGTTKPFYSLERADLHALAIAEGYDFLEYGIQTIEREQYCFPF